MGSEYCKEMSACPGDLFAKEYNERKGLAKLKKAAVPFGNRLLWRKERLKTKSVTGAYVAAVGSCSAALAGTYASADSAGQVPSFPGFLPFVHQRSAGG
jgi:hypothetical protein